MVTLNSQWQPSIDPYWPPPGPPSPTALGAPLQAMAKRWRIPLGAVFVMGKSGAVGGLTEGRECERMAGPWATESARQGV